VGVFEEPSPGQLSERTLWVTAGSREAAAPHDVQGASIGERTMELQTLTSFFMWCTIINGGLLILWTVFCIFMPDLVYGTQSKWFPIPRETFNIVIYSFLGAFKILFLVFNLVPFLALLILG
jgi:hypothetical protein